jgi:hypothetical protein
MVCQQISGGSSCEALFYSDPKNEWALTMCSGSLTNLQMLPFAGSGFYN